MKAIEKRAEIKAAAAKWQDKFINGAEKIGEMEGKPVWWHETLGVWALFGKTHGRGGIVRDWNAFGQQPHGFRSHIVVEVNQPPRGIDQNLQAVFARNSGKIWLLHQGRMSVSGSRVTEQDFIDATGLVPIDVEFSDGSTAPYHPIAMIEGPAASVQERMAAWVAQCARARASKLGADPKVLAAMGAVQAWEHGLSPEVTGEFEIAARDPVVARRRHAQVWRALAAELKRRKVPHSNDRVAQYGPDLFTYGKRDVLFEIKSQATSQSVFEGVGQLHIYEQLLSARFGATSYRKVLVVPEGIRDALAGPLAALKIELVAYARTGTKITFETKALASVLR
jgi:hypothetical protein